MQVMRDNAFVDFSVRYKEIEDHLNITLENSFLISSLDIARSTLSPSCCNSSRFLPTKFSLYNTN